MPCIRLQNVSKRYAGENEAAALDRVSFEVEAREVVTIVGPSGCGKSTLLRLLAGLDQPTSGSIEIRGRDVTHVPARDRNVAMVFQSYALYPHMTCYENLSLHLRLKKTPREEIDRRVRETARLLEIEPLLDKRPKELSGGQRQRVAVGRALIRQPDVFLFDEPLSNLDAMLRERVRHDLKQLFRKLEATVVYVTHDQVEAMTLAGRVVVLDRGRVQQIGPPEELYRNPANRFVASFIGSPSMNFFERDGAILGVRPEHIQLADAGEPALVEWIENLGQHYLIGLRGASGQLTAISPERPQQTRVHYTIHPEHIHAFDASTGASLAHRGDRRTADL